MGLVFDSFDLVPRRVLADHRPLPGLRRGVAGARHPPGGDAGGPGLGAAQGRRPPTSRSCATPRCWSSSSSSRSPCRSSAARSARSRPSGSTRSSSAAASPSRSTPRPSSARRSGPASTRSRSARPRPPGRSGCTFGGTMTQVILPQAFRATVPPLASVLIALPKNTSVAAVFGLIEATARMRYFTNNNRRRRPRSSSSSRSATSSSSRSSRSARTASSDAGGWRDEHQRPLRRRRARAPARGTASTRSSTVVLLVVILALVVLPAVRRGSARVRAVGAVPHPGLHPGAAGRRAAGDPEDGGLLDRLRGGLRCVFGVGKLSDHASLRWPCWLVVEFFRAVPVLLLMIFLFFSYGVGDGIGSFWSRGHRADALQRRGAGRGVPRRRSSRCRRARRRRRTPSACARPR